MLYTIIITLIYLFIVAVLGYLGFRHTKSSQDYLVAGRQIHPLIMALSYGSTFISTSAIVGFGGAAGQLGMGLLWLTVLNIFVGIFVAFVIFGKRTRKIGHNLDAHTFPELLGRRFDCRFIQGLCGLIIFLFMPIYATAVLKGGADFVQAYFNIPYDVSLFFFAVIVAIYVWMGGLKGVMYTDAFQALVMFVGMLLLLVFTYAGLGGVASAHQQLTDLFAQPEVQAQTAKLVAGGFRGWTSMPAADSPVWWSLVSTIIMGVGIGVLAQPQLIVRFMTVKSNRELNRAVLSGGIFILTMTGVAFTVGALSNVYFFRQTGSIALIAAAGNDTIIPQYIRSFIPNWFGAIFLLTLLAAGMSTLSSQFHTMGTAVGRDIYEKSLGGRGNTVWVTRTSVLIGVILSTTLAWAASKLDASLTVIASGTALFFGLCAASFLPAYLSALYVRSMPRVAVIAGILCGFFSSAFWIFFVHKKNASNLQLCQWITGKPSVLAGTAWEKWTMVDPLFVALPISALVTVVLWAVLTGAGRRSGMPSEHVDACFKGM